MAKKSAQKLPAYEPLLAAYHQAFAKELRSMLEALPICSGDHALDVGCGDGDYTGWLAPLVAPTGRVTGVDQLPTYLNRARRKWGRSPYAAQIRFEQGDIRRLPFAGDAFDFVWCAQSLYSFPDPPQALREMVRVLKPGGIVAILEDDTLHQVLLPWPIEAELALRRAEWRALEQERKEADRFYIARDLRRLFAESGLTPQRRKTYALHRECPVGRPERRFLDAYLGDLRKRARPYLSPSERRRWLPLLTPASGSYLPDQPHFSMTCLDHILWGKKK